MVVLSGYDFLTSIKSSISRLNLSLIYDDNNASVRKKLLIRHDPLSQYTLSHYTLFFLKR